MPDALLLLIVLLLAPAPPGDGDGAPWIPTDQLVAGLGAEDHDARERADAALAERGEVTRPALEVAAASDDPEVAARARRLLRRLDLRRDHRLVLRKLPWAEKALLDGGPTGAAEVLGALVLELPGEEPPPRIDDAAIAPLVASGLRGAPADVAAAILWSIMNRQALIDAAFPTLFELVGEESEVGDFAEAIIERRLGAGAAVPIDEIVELVERDGGAAATRVFAARAIGERRGGGAVALDSLLELVEDEVVSVRAEAIRALGLVGDGRGLPPVRTALANATEPSVRAAAIGAIAYLGGAEELAGVIEDEDEHERDLALEVLPRLPSAKAPRLVPLLGHTDSGVRRGVLFALGQLGNDEVAADVASLLDRGGQDALRAARTLGALGAVDDLVAALAHEELSVVVEASAGLAAIGAVAREASLPGLRSLLESVDPWRRRVAGVALIAIAPDEEHDATAVAIREAALAGELPRRPESLAQLVDAPEAGLVAPPLHGVIAIALADGDAIVRARAASALGRLPAGVKVEGTEALTALLIARATDVDAHETWLRVLGKVALDPEKALEPLIGALGADRSPIVRAWAAKSLGAMGADAAAATPALGRLLDGPSSSLAMQVARALGAIGSAARPAIPDLIAAFGKHHLAPGAATAIGAILADPGAEPHPGAATALGELVTGGHAPARLAAAHALAGIDPTVQGKARPSVTGRLTAAAEGDDDGRVRVAAALALARARRDPEPLVATAIAVLGSEEGPGPRIEAARALASFGPEARPAAAALQAVLDDDPASAAVRQEITAALEAIGEAD